MKSRLSYNLGLKIMAVLFAIALWMISVDINNPVEKSVFYNIQVQFVNTGTVTGQNKTYKVLENTDKVRVTVRAPKKVLSGISDKDITVQADFSEISLENGTVPIEATINDKYLDKSIESVVVDKSVLKLEIEERQTKQLAIEVVKEGTLPDGYVTGKIETETNTMTLTGPESAISSVSRAVAEVSMDNATSDIDMLTAITLLDADGKEINNSSIKKSIENVKVTVPILQTKEVPLTYTTSGIPAEGYMLTGTITASFDTVVIAGKETALNSVESIEIPDTELNVEGATGNVGVTVDVRKYLPADVRLANSGAQRYVDLVAEVEQIRRKSITITESTIQKLNVPEGWQAEILPEQGLRLNLSGLARYLNGIDEAAVVPHVDVLSILGEDGSVPAGDQEITVNCVIPDGVTQEGEITAIIRLTKLSEE